MKVNKFNEALKGTWKSTDKVLKVSIKDFEVSLEDIENTDAYQRAFDNFLKRYPNSKDYDAQKYETN